MPDYSNGSIYLAHCVTLRQVSRTYQAELTVLHFRQRGSFGCFHNSTKNLNLTVNLKMYNYITHKEMAKNIKEI